MTSNENSEPTGQQTPTQTDGQTALPRPSPPPPDTLAHLPTVTYICNSYKGKPIAPPAKDDAD